jgi:hypothetical protein
MRSSLALTLAAPAQTRKDMRILLSRPWNDQDVAALKKLWEEGVPVRKLALRFRRSQSAIRGKAVQLGLKRPLQATRRPESEELHAH